MDVFKTIQDSLKTCQNIWIKKKKTKTFYN